MKTTKEILTEYKRIRARLDCPSKWALLYARQWAEIKRLESDPKIKIELIADQDDLRVRGNAMCSGDDKLDKQVEDEILRRLDSGDVWAWASVEVKVTKGGLSESEYLGGCNYRDEQDFKRGGYYYDMLTTCLERIDNELTETANAACRDIATA